MTNKTSWHLLPTEGASELFFEEKELVYFPSVCLHSKGFNVDGKMITPHHIYITDSSLPIAGEYGYSKLHGIVKVTNNLWAKQEGLRRVIATTDPSLDGVDKIYGNTKARIILKEYMNLPADTKEVNFLEEFCRRYNPKDKSLREVAMEWWSSLSDLKKTTISLTNYSRSWRGLTGSEIESIYQKDKGVDVNKLANEKYNEYLNKNKSGSEPLLYKGFIEGFKANHSFQSTGQYSLEEVQKYGDYIGNGILRKDPSACLSAKDFFQSLQPQSKGEIVIEVEMENRCCGRCLPNQEDICVTDTSCDVHKVMGCEICFGEKGDRIKLNSNGQPTIIFK